MHYICIKSTTMRTVEERKAQWEKLRGTCDAEPPFGRTFEEHEANIKMRSDAARKYANARIGEFPKGEETEEWNEAWYSFAIGYAIAMQIAFSEGSFDLDWQMCNVPKKVK